MKASVYALFVAVSICSGAVLDDKALERVGDLRYLRAYTEIDQTGVQYEFTDNSPDLNAQGLSDVIESSCSTGIWFSYDETNYLGVWCYVIGVDGCTNWDSACVNTASSLRYAGSPNGLNDNYYNLYEFEDMKGEEFGGNTDLASLGAFDLRTSSIVITGQSQWTLYTELGMTGPSVCVTPIYESSSFDGIDMNYVYYTTMSDLGLPDDSIRSIARGCFSNRVVGAPLSHKTVV